MNRSGAVAQSGITRVSLVVLIVYSIPFSRLLDLPLPGFSFSVTDALILVGVLGLSLNQTSRQGIPWPRNWRFSLGLFLFVAAALASLPGAAYVDVSIRYLLSIGLKILLLWVVYSAIRSADDVRRFIQAYIRACTAIALLAIGQVLLLSVQGLPLVSVASFFAARNEMVFYLVPGLLLALGRTFESHDNSLLSWTPTVLIGLALLLSRGRAGILLSVCLGLLLALRLSKQPLQLIKKLFAGLLLAAMLIAGYSLIVGEERVTALKEQLGKRYSSAVYSELSGEYGSIHVRLNILTDAMQQFDRYWLLGLGADNFKQVSPELVDLSISETDSIQPHNSYLGVLVGTGIGGLMGFLLLLSAGVLGKIADARLPWSVYSRYAYVSIVLFLAVFDASHRYNIWLFLGLMLSIARLLKVYARS